MRLQKLIARPHVDGNRIEITWTVPALPTEVRVFRSSRSHPTRIGEGIELSDVRAGIGRGPRPARRDRLLLLLFTKSNGDPDWTSDPHNRLSEMATGSYDFGGQMFAMLPAIYHRYDATLTSPDVEPLDRDKGVLRRFLDLAGAELDQLYSLARAAVDLHDLERVDGQLLPLLAQWIGWRTDHGASVRAQRREIRHAPKIYERIGTFGALDATARRISGLQFQAKEFVHNIATTNEPERLNIWSTTRTDPSDELGHTGTRIGELLFRGPRGPRAPRVTAICSSSTRGGGTDLRKTPSRTAHPGVRTAVTRQPRAWTSG